MADISFTVQQDALTVIQNTHISANFDECKAALMEMIAPYASMVVTEDGIASAKSDRAKIRKVSERIDSARKAVKKVYDAPLKEFESKCKELIAICEKGSGNLDTQIKAFEDREKKEKLGVLRAYYEGLEGFDEERKCLTWEDVLNPRWENKTYGIEDAKADIDIALRDTRSDIETIRKLDPQSVPYLLTVYAGSHNLGDVIRKDAEIRERRMSEELRKAEELREPEGSRRPEKDTATMPSEGVRTFAVDFRVYATKEQLAALKSFLNANNIRYGKVPKEG